MTLPLGLAFQTKFADKTTVVPVFSCKGQPTTWRGHWTIQGGQTFTPASQEKRPYLCKNVCMNFYKTSATGTYDKTQCNNKHTELNFSNIFVLIISLVSPLLRLLGWTLLLARFWCFADSSYKRQNSVAVPAWGIRRIPRQ